MSLWLLLSPLSRLVGGAESSPLSTRPFDDWLCHLPVLPRALSVLVLIRVVICGSAVYSRRLSKLRIWLILIIGCVWGWEAFPCDKHWVEAVEVRQFVLTYSSQLVNCCWIKACVSQGGCLHYADTVSLLPGTPKANEKRQIELKIVLYFRAGNLGPHLIFCQQIVWGWGEQKQGG